MLHCIHHQVVEQLSQGAGLHSGDVCQLLLPLPAHEASLPHPLVLAIGVGHIKVVEVLLEHEDIELEIK